MCPCCRDLEFALTIDIDWVALSFVQTPEDIAELRELVGKKVRIMAKLEKPSAINYLDEVRTIESKAKSDALTTPFDCICRSLIYQTE